MPLLFICRIVTGVAIAGSLAGCSFNSGRPIFTASGFVTDDGVVRVWRKDDNHQHPLVLMSVYNPSHGTGTITTLYEYQNNLLFQIKRTDTHNHYDSIHLRFTNDGSVSFMQRQLETQRQKLSSDDITQYQYQARQTLEMSDALNARHVRLRQGYWQRGGVKLCNGEIVNPRLSKQVEEEITQRVIKSNQRLSVAWLEGPEGHELLMVTHDDVCLDEPTEKTF